MMDRNHQKGTFLYALIILEWTSSLVEPRRACTISAQWKK